MINPCDLSLTYNGRRVIDVIASVNEAGNYCNVKRRRFLCNQFQCVKIVIYKPGFKQEVFRWITGNRKLRECNDVNSLLIRVFHKPEDLSGIAIQIPDTCI